MEAPKIFDYYTADSVAEETVIEPEVCPEEPCEAEAEDCSEIYDSNSSRVEVISSHIIPDLNREVHCNTFLGKDMT